MIKTHQAIQDHPDIPSLFQPLTVTELATYATRLLKFRHPIHYPWQGLVNLLSRKSLHSEINKKYLSQCSPAVALELFTALAYQTLNINKQPTTLSLDMNLLLLIEQFQHYHLENWILEDIEQHTVALTEPLPSYHMESLSKDSDFPLLLRQFGYQDKCFDALTCPYQSYLLCKTLTHSFPWIELFEALEKTKGTQLSRQLQRFEELYLLLEEKEPDGLLDDDFSNASEVFKRLSEFSSKYSLSVSAEFQMSWPVGKLLIVEGNTEEIVIPHCAELMGLNLNVYGVHIIAAGGKNQVPELYRRYRHQLNEATPIVVLLDKDAESQYQQLNELKISNDKIVLLNEGEFEDLYSDELLLQVIEEQYELYEPIDQSAFERARQWLNKQYGTEKTFWPRAAELHAIWKLYGLGEFDKTTFAAKLTETLSDINRIPPAIQGLVTTLFEEQDGQ